MARDKKISHMIPRYGLWKKRELCYYNITYEYYIENLTVFVLFRSSNSRTTKVLVTVIVQKKKYVYTPIIILCYK